MGLQFYESNEKILPWHFGLNKSISKNISLDISYALKPYQYTTISIDSLISFKEIGTKILIHIQETIQAEVSILKTSFKDGNSVQTLYSWLLFSIIKLDNFKAFAGYGFHYSDSKKNNFKSIRSLEYIVENFDSLEQIKGIYDPYFTPEKMISHAVLGQANWKPVRWFELKTTGKFGFSAKADNPYIFLDELNGQLFLHKAFFSQNFTPIETKIELVFSLSKKSNLTLSHSYFKSLFYSQNRYQIWWRINIHDGT